MVGPTILVSLPILWTRKRTSTQGQVSACGAGGARGGKACEEARGGGGRLTSRGRGGAPGSSTRSNISRQPFSVLIVELSRGAHY